MKIGPGLIVPALAELVLLMLYALDVLAGILWPEWFVVPGRILVVAAAAAVAFVVYHAWSVAAERTPLVNAAMGAGLVGGAALASSVTTAAEGRLLGSGLLATLGVAAVVAAVVCHQIAAVKRSTS